MSAASDSDLDDLLARCHRQEPAAQRALYLRFAGQMLGIARRYAYTAPEAEDIVQEAFVKVFSHLKEFRVGNSLEGWIRRIVVTTAINYWRAGQMRRATETIAPLNEDLETVAVAPVALTGLDVADVLQLIEQLPHGCRVVLLLYAVDGYSHAEIAELLSNSGKHF